ncbi:YphA family membrane protein [Pontibacillus marinus]|uniref:Uncharacterized protein n=1 Tax=Pontibacillus marinus BH030004 = DSM 16465 TaxID=1385511 RepID=A0A0A5HLZ1_9BACI|nr:hypothetical protein [Pontibacillus marinus]KGX84647.1 hypothetical protein N783_16310 [Pontibacillus marinus BH030004 = DSM 16465]
MDGIYFIYINWLLWVTVYFFMPKSQKRTGISISLLLLIITFSFEIKISFILINVANVCITIISIVVIAMHAKQIRTTCLALSVCIGYVGALLWEMVSPVWIFAPRLLVYSLLAFLLMLFISHSMWLRMAIWGLGASVGEIIYSFILMDYGFQDAAGDKGFLDIYSVVIVLIVITSLVGKFTTWMENTITEIVKRKAGIKT